MPEQRIGLTEGLLIAGVPVAGYWFAFLYDLGYCRYFDILAWFIDVGILNVFVSTVGLLGLLALVSLYANPLFMILRRLPAALRSAFLRIAIPFAFIAGYALVGRLMLCQFVLLFTPFVVLLLFLEFIFPLITQRGTRGYLAKLDAQNVTEPEHHTLVDAMVRSIGRERSLFFYLIFVFSFVAYFAGGYNAKAQTDFIVLTGSTELVVLKTYKASFLAAKFDRVARSVSPQYTVIPADTQLFQFKFERVGRLLPSGLK